MRKAKISFEYPFKTYTRRARIIIDDMSIPLIEENSNKASSSKSNSETEINKPPIQSFTSLSKFNFRSCPQKKKRKSKHYITAFDENKSDLNLEKFIDMFKKLSIETNLSSFDSESTGSDWYDLDSIKSRKNRVHIKKKKVDSPIRKL
ncbi:2509_t:CDS:1, partial [Dentiscutata erythropus]